MNDDNDERRGRITFSAKNPRRDVHEEVVIRAKERQTADRKLSFADAMMSVFAADPELHRLYLATTPPLRHNARQE